MPNTEAQTARPAVDECIALVLRGDRDLFEHIVRAYQHRISRIVYHPVLGRQAVDDLVQTVFLRAYAHLEQFDRDRDFEVWIDAIARNTLREALRSHGRYRKRIEGVALQLAQRGTERAEPAGDDELMLAALRRCLGKLPVQAAESVRLRYTDGLSYEALATRLGRTANAMRHLIGRIRQRLRECVDQEMNPL